MRVSTSSLLSLAALAVSSVSASWSFEDATVTIQTKGAGVGSGLKESIPANGDLGKTLTLGSTNTLKLVLTTRDGKTPKRPHQAFLTLRDPITGLEDSFPLTVKDSGKAKLDLTQKDLPFQFVASSEPAEAKIILASFGSSEPTAQSVFKLDVVHDAAGPVNAPEAPLRYGALEEIKHIFRAGPKSPPVVISSFFLLLIIGTLPALFSGWLLLGANVSHFGNAINTAPLSHILFFGSIVAIEGVFFLYYTSWNLFQTLPAAGVLGVVAIVSGSRALTEVQERRLGGLR